MSTATSGGTMQATISNRPCNICAKPESAINHRGVAARYGHYFEAMPTTAQIPAPRTAEPVELDDLPLCTFNADPVPDMDDHVLACGDCFAYYRLEN